MILLQLLWAFVQVGAFSFGGGYAALPLIEEQVVKVNHWLTAQEFTDIITISQMTPGPIAINSASFVGIRMGGILGTVVATFGCILPSLVIVLLLSYFFFKYRNLRMVQGIVKGLRPGVVALIAASGYGLMANALWGDGAFSFAALDWFAVALFAAALVVLRKWKPNPIYVMVACGVVGALFYGLVLGVGWTTLFVV